MLGEFYPISLLVVKGVVSTNGFGRVETTFRSRRIDQEIHVKRCGVQGSFLLMHLPYGHYDLECSSSENAIAWLSFRGGTIHRPQHSTGMLMTVVDIFAITAPLLVAIGGLGVFLWKLTRNIENRLGDKIDGNSGRIAALGERVAKIEGTLTHLTSFQFNTTPVNDPAQP